MALHLPVLPPLPAWLHRRPAELKPEPWPGNPRTVADDLAISQANEAQLAEQLRENRQLLDGNELVRRLDQAERRATLAEAEHERIADELTAAHRQLREVTADRDGLRKQLDRTLGYDGADLAAINTGTSQPIRKG